MSIDMRHYIPAILVALTVFSSIVLVLSLVRIQNVSFPPDNKYGMVFDAGSSHTSLFVYQWTSDKTNDTGVVSQTLSCNVQGPGISSYANDPPKAGESLRSCLEDALKVIPDERQREVPVYLGATAGMRLLSMQNKSAADQVLNEVAKVIQQYPVNFHGARIITGEEEGAYGWITINYLLDSFTKYSPKQRDWIHPQSAKILGALDLGGASTQISFIPIDPITDQTKASKFRLYGFNYTIYTHSYLCYGQNQALKQLILKITEAFSAFYYTFSFLNLTRGQPLAIVEDTVQKFCARNWTDLKSSYPKEKVQWLREYCANANYILVLLLDAYKFNQTSWSSIKFQMKAANTDIGWALGYVLNLTNMIPAEAPEQMKGQQRGLWAAAIFFIVLTLAFCIVGLLIHILG
ncbi:ectonucleoside triphosphate diphosphohydrolase 8-like isoform X2 [Dermochelys coriacea]|uniref:ectonucleoside triphosphate diphosphohydrolase 8-like isoform X2 n=1 Tax=Dermochelys coriacea TaxID=27794 RepID=UPI0018E8FD13|nr:ectonucleoside triphosphate diphosphohydrolase 8-like isoform X2 [Dermochelys coriacea]